jgi:amino-acid N-acetyltransferase
MGERGTGVARKLVAILEDNARSSGPLEVWLLRTTAERFFEVAGYGRVSRDEVPCDVWACRQYAALCPSTAACMQKRLHAESYPYVIEWPVPS